MLNENPLFGQKDSTIIHTSFMIADKPAKQYEGSYKNGKPHNGYFLAGDREFKWVDYYENGTVKFQYSNNYIENLEKYLHPIYDIKSTYENGKIISGEAYTIIEKGFVTKKIEKGKLKTILFDLFAVHYFNRITLEKQQDVIKISNKEEPQGETRYYFKDKLLTVEVLANKKILFYNEYITFDLRNLPKNRTVYQVKNGKVTTCSANKAIDLTQEDYEQMGDLKINLKMMEGMLMSPAVVQSNDLDKVFEQMAAFLSQDESVYAMYNEKEPMMMTHLSTDSNGKITNGINFTDSKTPFYEIYKDGKSIKKEEKSLADFQKIAMKYLEERFSKN